VNLFDNLLGILSPRRRKIDETRRKAREELDNNGFVPARLHLEAVGSDTVLKEVIEVSRHRT
jgi:hypothetical protein